VKTNGFGLLCVLSASIRITALAQEGPSYFAGTGHWYEPVLMTNGVEWPAAQLLAAGRGGYLCTITNAAENAFVAGLVDVRYYSDPSMFGDILGPWLGGFRHANSAEWQWVTGEPFNYTAWYSGQPDGFGGSEQRLQFYARFTTGSTWGDHPGTPLSGFSLPRGFIVEYDRAPLRIARTNTVVTVTWPVSAQSWRLESATALTNPAWTNVVTGSFQTNLVDVSLSATNPPGTAFYRLAFP
jgi:hypothetical protein